MGRQHNTVEQRKSVQLGTCPHLLGDQGNAWSCDNCGRLGTSTFLLGNKGCHIYNGNPAVPEVSTDEVTLTKDCREFLRQDADESVGCVCINGRDIGMGFRVGESSFMTAHHVVRDVIDDIVEIVVYQLDKSEPKANTDDLAEVLGVAVVKHGKSEDILSEMIMAFLNKTHTNLQSLLNSLSGIIDTEEITEKITKRWKKKCMVQFPRHGTFSIDWDIQFGDTEADYIIMKLKETEERQTFPRPCLLDEIFKYGKFLIIMYRSEKEHISVCQNVVFYKDDISLQQDSMKAFVNAKTLKLIERDKGIDDCFMENQYKTECWRAHDVTTGRVIIGATESFIEGSSGSPIVRVTSSRPRVAMIHQGGLPSFFYDRETIKHLDVPKACLFQRGTTMQHVDETLLKNDKTELRNDIFGNPESDKMSLILETWEKERTYCHVTPSIRTAMDEIESGSHVCITGVRKAGKTKTLRHIALSFRDRGYIVYPVDTPEEFMQHFGTSKLQLFVFDDFLGKTFCHQKRKSWRDNSGRIEEMLKSSNNTKLLSSLEVTIYFDQKTEKSDCFLIAEDSRTIHLSHRALRLQDQREILKYNLMRRGIGDSEEFIDRIEFCPLEVPLEYFYPLICEHFCEKHFSGDKVTKKELSISENLFPAMASHFKQMKDTNKLQFIALVLCVAFGDAFTSDILSPLAERHGVLDKETVNTRNIIISSFHLEINGNLQDIGSALESLVGTYVYRYPSKNRYKISDPLFSDAVCYVYGDISLMLKCCTVEFIRTRVRFDHPLPNDDDYIVIVSEHKHKLKVDERLRTKAEDFKRFVISLIIMVLKKWYS